MQPSYTGQQCYNLFTVKMYRMKADGRGEREKKKDKKHVSDLNGKNNKLRLTVRIFIHVMRSIILLYYNTRDSTESTQHTLRHKQKQHKKLFEL